MLCYNRQSTQRHNRDTNELNDIISHSHLHKAQMRKILSLTNACEWLARQLEQCATHRAMAATTNIKY